MFGVGMDGRPAVWSNGEWRTVDDPAIDECSEPDCETLSEVAVREPSGAGGQRIVPAAVFAMLDHEHSGKQCC